MAIYLLGIYYMLDTYLDAGASAMSKGNKTLLPWGSPIPI